MKVIKCLVLLMLATMSYAWDIKDAYINPISPTFTNIYGNGTSLSLYASGVASGAVLSPNGDLAVQNMITSKYMLNTSSGYCGGIFTTGNDINVFRSDAGNFTYLYGKHTSSNVNSGAGVRLDSDAGQFYLEKYSSGKAAPLTGGSRIYEGSVTSGFNIQAPLMRFSDLAWVNVSTWIAGSGLTMSPGSQINTSNLNVTNTGYALSMVIPTLIAANVQVSTGSFSRTIDLMNSTNTARAFILSADANATITSFKVLVSTEIAGTPQVSGKMVILDNNGYKALDAVVISTFTTGVEQTLSSFLNASMTAGQRLAWWNTETRGTEGVDYHLNIKVYFKEQ